MVDDEGEEIESPPEGLLVPNIKGEALVLGFRLMRRGNGAITRMGYPIPCVDLYLETTEGEFRFILTRDEMSQLGIGLSECVIDG